MNIVQLQDLLKGMPDARLQQELQAPTGAVPQYLVLSEVVRRDKIRQDSSASQPSKTTVVEDVMNAAQNPAGIPAAIANMQQADMQPLFDAQQYDMQQGEVPAYASGGFISPSESMGNLGVRGYPQAPKPTPMLGQNVSSNSMFKPNMNPPAPQLGGFPSQNVQQNTNVPAAYNDPYNNNYTEDYSYANGGAIKMSDGALVPSIIAVESGGNPRAKNPRSSAAGLGQFIDTTWLAFLEDTQPGLVNRIGKSAALELKMNPELSTKAIDWYGKKNTQELTRAGFEPSKANLYLAHFLGAGGAKTVLGSNPNKPITDLFDAKVINANPFLKNMTVADLKNWTAKKMGSATAVPVASSDPEGYRGTGIRADTTSTGYSLADAIGITDTANEPNDGSIDFSSLSGLGKSVMKRTPREIPILPETPGNPEMAAAAATRTPDEILAEYRAIRQMAGGGAVGMDDGGIPPSAAFLETLTPEQKASMTPQELQRAWVEFYTDAGKRRMGANYAAPRSAVPTSPGQRAVATARTPEEIVAANKLLLEEQAAASGEPRARGPAPGLFTDDFRATPLQLRMAASEAEKARNIKEEKSPLDKLLEYYTSRDAQMQKMYQDQIDEEKRRMEESGGLGAFLRRMGIGMLTDSSSFGKSIQAGLASATSGYEEGRQTAMDRLRELQLKQQMAGLEAGGQLAKLEYDAATSGQLGVDDLIKLRGQAIQERTDRAKALADAMATPEEIAADPVIKNLDSQIEAIGLRLGIGSSGVKIEQIN